VLIVGVNVGARNVQIHLHDKQPCIRVLVMTPLDGQMTLADSIVVTPESPGEFRRSGNQGGRSVDVPEGNGNGTHGHLRLRNIRALNARNGLGDGLEATFINWTTAMRTLAIEPGLQSMQRQIHTREPVMIEIIQSIRNLDTLHATCFFTCITNFIERNPLRIRVLRTSPGLQFALQRAQARTHIGQQIRVFRHRLSDLLTRGHPGL
jgi:hypothetical protein